MCCTNTAHLPPQAPPTICLIHAPRPNCPIIIILFVLDNFFSADVSDMLMVYRLCILMSRDCLYVGDVIGCGVTFAPSNSKHCSVFFTYNGCEIGRVRTNYVESGLFPSITLTTPADKVAVTFLETFKPKSSPSFELFVGLMRIHNCSYSDQIVRFSGGGNSGYTNASAMAQFAVPLSRERNYFAANLVHSEDAILIGLAAKDYPMRFAPGDSSVSVAYNTVKGCVRAVYSSDSHYNMEAPTCKKGDTIGCGIDRKEGSKGDEEYVFFTKNGVIVCRVKLIQLLENLFPVVGFVPSNRNSVVFMNWTSPIYDRLNTP